jgi:hypothetical protein
MFKNTLKNAAIWISHNSKPMMSTLIVTFSLIKCFILLMFLINWILRWDRFRISYTHLNYWLCWKK